MSTVQIKPVQSGTSKYSWLEVITWQHEWHTSSWLQAAQQHRYTSRNNDTVNYWHFWCRIHLNRTQMDNWCWHQQCTALLWNPLRHLYHHQEKETLDGHKGSHCIAWQWPELSRHAALHVLEGAAPSSKQLLPTNMFLSMCLAPQES